MSARLLLGHARTRGSGAHNPRSEAEHRSRLRAFTSCANEVKTAMLCTGPCRYWPANGLLWIIDADPVWSGYGMLKPCGLPGEDRRLRDPVRRGGSAWIRARSREVLPNLAGPLAQADKGHVMAGVDPELRAF